MPYYHITGAPTQYQKADGTLASGYYLKFYASGTTTPISLYSDIDGSGALAKCQLNSSGYPINGSNAVFIPSVNQRYKIALYRNSTDADANTFGNADWVLDNNDPFGFGQSAVVDTLSDLKALNTAVYTHAVTLGYDTKGDAGHGEYYYDSGSSATADDFLVIQPNSGGGRWKLKIGDGILPRQAGCKFDDSTDDSTNFNKCTSASNTLGKPIYLPAGTGVMKNIYVYSGMAILGLGRQSKIKLKGSAGANDWLIKNYNAGTNTDGTDAAVPGDNNIVLWNFELDGNKANQTNAISTILFRRVRYSILNKLHIINAKGVAFDGCNAIDHMFITENLFQNNNGVDIRILWVSNRNIIANNVIIGANLPTVDGGEAGSVTSDAIQILAPNVTGGANFNCAEDIIANNVIKGKVNGIVLDGAFETVIAGNTMGTQTASSIVTKATGTFITEGLTIVGNQITQEASAGAGYGLDLQVIKRAQITGNTVFSQNVDCIHIGAGADNSQVTITGNNLRFAAAQDVADCIYILDLGDSIISNNNCVFGKVGINIPQPTVGAELRSLKVTDNRIISPKRQGIYLGNNGAGRTIKGVSFDNNNITNPGSAAVNTYDAILIEQSGGTMSDITVNGVNVHDFNTNVRDAVRFSGTITNMLCEPNIKAQGLNGVLVTGYYNAAPASGTWYAGQRIYDFSPTSGSVEGWICTVAGTPGTWKTFGTIS